jgi:hypothetical protein
LRAHGHDVGPHHRLDTFTAHLLPLPLTWNLSVFVVHAPTWKALAPDLLAREVLPRWLERCGRDCAVEWNRRIAPVVGVLAEPK